ncbi:replication protein a3 [Holotrichia oblita]|uniref:Replication protein a3 n=2 Tax=Holotrichia oblita TaxID=644536 RepID=A0ACB9T1R6_HOLOL|nr:replication protein a3 [Holotrichia oblita]KAI4460753.1 replication protein a3 [Holotrichia oblita]
MVNMETENIREIVNGQQLPQFIGKKVSVTGLVTNINPNCITFDISTTDNKTIKVNLKKPYNDLLEGYVEVHGTAQNNVIIGDEVIQFSDAASKEFDVGAHNTLCQLLHTVPDLWRTEKY